MLADKIYHVHVSYSKVLASTKYLMRDTVIN